MKLETTELNGALGTSAVPVIKNLQIQDAVFEDLEV